MRQVTLGQCWRALTHFAALEVLAVVGFLFAASELLGREETSYAIALEASEGPAETPEDECGEDLPRCANGRTCLRGRCAYTTLLEASGTPRSNPDAPPPVRPRACTGPGTCPPGARLCGSDDGTHFTCRDYGSPSISVLREDLVNLGVTPGAGVAPLQNPLLMGPEDLNPGSHP